MKTTKITITDKVILGNIAKMGHYEIESFVKDAKDYIKHIQGRSMCCVIRKVSSSGMSRNIKFSAFVPNKDYSYYRNFYALFKALGFTAVKDGDDFRIGGCGMDMIFHTNYTIIHKLHNLGFIDRKECDKLAQMTPTVL